jgi:F-type H+-transporting ATPase subunit a
MEEHAGSWLNPLVQALPAGLRPYLDAATMFALLAAVLLGILAWRSSRRLSLVPANGLQSVGEWTYEELLGLTRGVLGHEAERYVWILGSFFIYIIFINLLGVIPGCISPSTRLNTTIPLALCAITIAQVIGMKHNGWRYWGRFCFHVWRIPIPNPLKIVEEIVKPISLSIRLFGNIFGDDTAALQFALMGAGALGIFFSPAGLTTGLLARGGGFLEALLWVALTAVMLGFALLVAFIQAFVFSLLAGAYIMFAVEME